MKEIVIGSRGSRLALKQTEIAVEELKRTVSDCRFRVERIVTEGDKNRSRPLQDIGGSGLFTKEIEYRLAGGQIDVAVHSLKDLPTSLDRRLEIGAVLPRANPADALVSEEQKHLDRLPAGAMIGTGSARRKAQLLSFRPDLQVAPVRGNVDTRLRRLEKQGYDALVLAAAGLQRLGLEDKITEFLPGDIFVPAAGQGAVALQIRAEDMEIKKIVQKINDRATEAAVGAERTMLECLDAGCKEPIGAFAVWEANELSLKGMVASERGREVVSTEMSAELLQPDKVLFKAEKLGEKAASDLLSQGARKILQQLRR